MFGEKADRRNSSPTLIEEDRLNRLRLDETTSIEKVADFFGTRCRFDISGGCRPEGFDLRDCFEGIYGKIRLKNFRLFGPEFHLAELRVNVKKEAEFEITKYCGNGFYARFNIESYNPINVGRARLSLVQEKRGGKFSVGFGYDFGGKNADGENSKRGFFGNILYTQRFGKKRKF